MTSPAYDRCSLCLQPGHVAASCPRAVGRRALTADQGVTPGATEGDDFTPLTSGADRARARAAAPAIAAAFGLVGPPKPRRIAESDLHRRMVSQLRDIVCIPAHLLKKEAK